jgi:hypothetical protein
MRFNWKSPIMKSLITLTLGFGIAYFVFSNKPVLKEIIENKIYPNKNVPKNIINRYGNYDPGKDMKFSKEERDYFNEIAKKTEFSSEDRNPSRWMSDMKIFVEGQKQDYLMEELNKIVLELNEIIDPIDIVVVEKKEDANYVIYFCHADEYEKHEPAVKPYIQRNWGMFCIDGGEVIKSGSMYVDIERCKGIKAQKHLLREELTQSLGLKNDSYSHPESIFYQVWSETTEYAPIDRVLIDMLYNHW